MINKIIIIIKKNPESMFRKMEETLNDNMTKDPGEFFPQRPNKLLIRITKS
jgi:hypothetical protein